MATVSEQFHAEMAAVATDLLSSEQLGGTVTFMRYSGGTIDPVTNAQVAPTPETFTPNGGIKEYDDALVDGTRIISGDKRVVIDAATYTPEPSDKVVIDSEEWPIVRIKKVDFVGVPIIYEIQARK